MQLKQLRIKLANNYIRFVNEHFQDRGLKIKNFFPKELGVLAGIIVLIAFLWRYMFMSQEDGLKHLVEGVTLLSILPGWSFTLANTRQWNKSVWPIAITIAIAIYLLAIFLYFIARRQSRLSIRRPLSVLFRFNDLYILILISMIFPLLFLKTQFVLPDGSDYLASALDMALGQGYSGYRGELRGPIFPFLISIAFRFYDANVETGLIVPKLVGMLNFIILYFIGKTLFNRSVGFIGAILALSSYDQLRLYFFSSHLLDGTLALFMNLFLLFIILALEGSNLTFFALGGISLGAAVLVKQSGIIWVTIPWIIFFLSKEYRHSKNYIGVWLTTATFLLTLYPWMIYVYNSSQKVFLLNRIGDHSTLWLLFNFGFYSFFVTGLWIAWIRKRNTNRLLRGALWPEQKVSQFFPLIGFALSVVSVLGISFFFAKGVFVPSRYPALLSYLQDIIEPVFGNLFPLVGLAWGGTLLLAYRDRKHRLLAVAFLLNLPLFIHLSYYRFEARNYFSVILISYLLLGYYVDCIARYVEKIIKELTASQTLRNISIRAGAVMGLILLTAYPLPMITEQVEQNWLFSEQDRYTPLSYNVDNRIVHETAFWIQKHIIEGTSLLFFYAWEGQLKFELNGRYPINTYRFDVLTEYGSGDNFLDKLAASKENYVYILREEDPTFLALFLYPESSLYKMIRDTKSDYIVVGDRNASLQGFQDFFDTHPAFTQVFRTEETGYGTAVYRINPELINTCPSCPTVVQADALLELLDLVKHKKLDEYQFLQRLGEHISIATRPGITPNGKWAEAYAKIGEIYQEHGDVESALLAYNRAVAIDSRFGAHYWPIIQSYYSQLLKKYLAVGNDQSEIPQIIEKELPELARDILRARAELDTAVFTYRYRMDNQNPELSSPAIYDFLQHFPTQQNNRNLREDIFTINQLPKKVLFQHPPSAYTYTVALPDQPGELSCDIALSPEVWKPGMGDGVQFDINLLDNQGNLYSLFSKYIDPKNRLTDRNWISCGKISLELWAGQTVKIIFATLPNSNNNYDWAGWGEPRIVFPGYYNFLSKFSLAEYDDHLGNIHRDWMAIQDDFRDILYQHPTSQITYKSVPILEYSSLHFGIGLDPSVWSPAKGDGVEFEILIQDSPNHKVQVFNRYIDPKNNSADRHWFDFQVDLSRFAGKMVDVQFVTHPGLAGNSDYDWAGWSNPILVSVP